MARTRKRALWVVGESSYGVDPDANDDGAEYTYVPGTVGDLKDGKAQYATDYATGRNFPTKPVAGPDGWSFDLEVPVTGMATAAGSGTNASTVTDDYLDILAIHMFAAKTTFAGTTVSATGAASITAASDNWSVQDIIPVHEALVPSGAARTQWTSIRVDSPGGTYSTVAPAWDAVPTTSALIYGAKLYQPSDAGGASLAFVYQQDDIYYNLLGGRVTSATISGVIDTYVKLKLSISGDTKTQESARASLPASTFSRVPCKALLSPVFLSALGTPKVACKSFEIDLGISASPVTSTAAADGRADYQSIMMAPVITLQPLFTNEIQNLKRALTSSRILIQFGAGVLSGGVLNTCAIHAEEVHAVEADPADDAGIQRQSLKLQVSDSGEFSSGVLARKFQFLRA